MPRFPENTYNHTVAERRGKRKIYTGWLVNNTTRANYTISATIIKQNNYCIEGECQSEKDVQQAMGSKGYLNFAVYCSIAVLFVLVINVSYYYLCNYTCSSKTPYTRPVFVQSNPIHVRVYTDSQSQQHLFDIASPDSCR